MQHPERSASSTRRTPSTPTNPSSVGRPPRKATRNSLSQRLSRLVRSAGSPDGRAVRADLPAVAITVERSKLRAADANTGSWLKISAEGRSEIESQPDSRDDRKTIESEECGLPRRGIEERSRKPAVVVVGHVQHLAVKAQFPFCKRPGLVRAQVKALVG